MFRKPFFFSPMKQLVYFVWLIICPRTWSCADNRWTSKFISKKWKLVGCYDFRVKRLEKFIPQTCVIARITRMIIQDGDVFMAEMCGELDWLLQKYKERSLPWRMMYHVATFLQSVRRTGIFQWGPVPRKCCNTLIWPCWNQLKTWHKKVH